MNKQILEKVTSIFLALILGISSGLSLANIAKAGGAYSITGDYSISGFTVTLSGTASANPYVGKCNDQHLSIDWDTDGNHIFDKSKDVPADTFDKICTGGTGNDHNGGSFINAPWFSTYTYSQPGSYTIIAKVYHGNAPGAEGSEAATYLIR